MNEKVVVTGGVGSHLVRYLLDENYEVHVIDNLISGKLENIDTRTTFHKEDIRNIDKISQIIKGSSFVFHLAALPRVQYSIKNQEETHDVNVIGTLKILYASRFQNVKLVNFIFLFSLQSLVKSLLKT